MPVRTEVSPRCFPRGLVRGKETKTHRNEDYGLRVGEILHLLDSWGLVRDVFFPLGFLPFNNIILGLCPQFVYRQKPPPPPTPQILWFSICQAEWSRSRSLLCPWLGTQRWVDQLHPSQKRTQFLHPGRLTAPTNHPFRKENYLNQTSMIMFPVSLQGCISTVFVSGFGTQPTNCFKLGDLRKNLPEI